MKEEFYQDKTGEDIKEEGFSKKEEELMPKKSSSRLWSVLALSVGILCLLLSLTRVVGVIIGVFCVLLSLISRIKLGYFDRITIMALILGVFGASACLLTTLFYYVPWLGEITRFYL